MLTKLAHLAVIVESKAWRLSITSEEPEFFENTLCIAKPRTKTNTMDLQVFAVDDESEVWALTLDLSQ